MRVRVPVDDGVSLEVVDRGGAGDGGGDGVPAFLLVHGLASNLRLWDGVADRLVGGGHRVVAVDLRGHGRSDKPASGYDVPRVADDLAAVIDALALDRPVVAGQSWGGNVVLELASRHPERVGAVALVDGGWIELTRRFASWAECAEALAPPSLDGALGADVAAELRRRHPDWPEAGIAGQLACYEQRPDGTVAPWLTRDRHLAALRGLWEHRPSTRYADVAVPVLLLPAGAGPTSAGPGGVEVGRAEAGLDRVRTVWLPGDHDLHAQHPAAVAAHVAGLLEEAHR